MKATTLPLMYLFLSFLPHDAGENHFKSMVENIVDSKHSKSEKKLLQSIRLEGQMEVTEHIQQYGYPAENHTILTDDEYVLILHRIPHGKINSLPGTPILLLHGLGCHSGMWIANGYDSVAYILADDIYDVWMINFRGNPYTNHIEYADDNPKFWDFSWEDHADYDLTASIDYILDVTKYAKILVVSVSLGTTVSLALLSAKPEYNKKVAGLAALAPIQSQAYLSSVAMLPMKKDPHLEFMYHTFAKPGQIGECPIREEVMLSLCPTTDPFYCEMLYTVTAGHDPALRNRTRDPVLHAYCCSGTSKKNAVHYSQMKKRNSMRRFDYGKIKNVVHYGQTSPPTYDLRKIRSPIALLYGANETYPKYPIGFKLLTQKLKNIVARVIFPHQMGMKKDFVWFDSPRSPIYDNILSVLNLMWY